MMLVRAERLGLLEQPNKLANPPLRGRITRRWSVSGSEAVPSCKGVDDAKLAFDQQAILHVLAP
jgi:hypothetical protein